MLLSPKKVLAISPHPDDIELGAGALLNRFVEQGSEVSVVYLSSCEESIPEGLISNILLTEANLALERLGVRKENRYFYDFRVRNFHESRQELLESFVRLNRGICPDLVICPCSFDLHQDHRVVYEECFRAFKKTSVLGYIFPWNVRVSKYDVSFNFENDAMNKKLDLLECYKSQMGRSYFQTEILRSWAKVNGINSSGEFAELFEAVRLSFR